MVDFGWGHGCFCHGPYSAVPDQPGGDTAPAVSVSETEARAESKARSPGVLDELSNALTAARAALSNTFELLTLEGRRAGLALMWMVAWGLIAAVLIVAGWLGLMGALALWAVSWGVSLLAAMLVLALINVLAAAILLMACVKTSRDLLFPATRRQVAGKHPVKADD